MRKEPSKSEHLQGLSVLAGEEDGPDEEFWQVARPHREPASNRWFLPAVLAILTVATPWYLPSSTASKLISGLPVWVWVALAGALSLSIVTAYGALFLWRDRAQGDEFAEGSDGS